MIHTKLLLALGMLTTLVGAAVETIVPPPASPCGNLTDATILIIIGGILSIIAAIGKVWLDVIAGNRETAKVKIMVNGQRGEMLAEMAALKRLVAEMSGRKDDQTRATAAQVVADDHKEVVEEAKKLP